MNPLSGIFGGGVALRNALYNRRLLPVHKLSRPVVSIGNLSVGGSGKTPFVIALGQLLAERGISFDVLSRGYGRRSAEVAVVDPQGSAEQFGDEPLLIAQKTNAPVVVGADRYQAGLLAEKNFSSKIHLLDDGFQHRRLHRDFDIVIVLGDDLRDTLLPVGRLREPVSALRRADAIVARKAPAEWCFPDKPTWRVRTEIMRADFAGRKAVAFCGIARPRQFLESFDKSEILEAITFPDHHRYSSHDVDRLLRTKKRNGAEILVTTEKDKINLGSLADSLEPLHISFLYVELESPQAALDHLLRTLEQRCGCRF